MTRGRPKGSRNRNTVAQMRERLTAERNAADLASAYPHAIATLVARRAYDAACAKVTPEIEAIVRARSDAMATYIEHSNALSLAVWHLGPDDAPAAYEEAIAKAEALIEGLNP